MVLSCIEVSVLIRFTTSHQRCVVAPEQPPEVEGGGERQYELYPDGQKQQQQQLHLLETSGSLCSHTENCENQGHLIIFETDSNQS